MELNAIPPLFPSARWMLLWFKARTEGKSEEEAIFFANSFLSNPKEFARFSIEGGSHEKIILSIPIQGGGKLLKYPSNLPMLKLSHHGDWKRIHLGAFEACLGKKPFFPYIIDTLKNVYDNKEIILLKDFNLAIYRIFCTFLFSGVKLSEINSTISNPSLEQYGTEMAKHINPELSIINPISDFGKVTLLSFLSFK